MSGKLKNCVQVENSVDMTGCTDCVHCVRCTHSSGLRFDDKRAGKHPEEQGSRPDGLRERNGDEVKETAESGG